VLSGECVAVIANEERRMRRWDYFYSPPGTAHVIAGAGDGPSVILMFGSPDSRRKVEWIANETAAKYGASVARTTSLDTEAYGEPLPEVVRVRAPRPLEDP
jgi:oxalate decarboxylase/phosphoglucose isomerase-like protein (cupin superfamily)